MKLSDIDEIKEAAAEYHRLVAMEKFIADGLQVFDIRFSIRRVYSDANLEVAFSMRSGLNMEDFQRDIRTAVKNQREFMQTQLALYGVTDFEVK